MSEQINKAKVKFMEGLQARSKPVKEGYGKTILKGAARIGKSVVGGAAGGAIAGAGIGHIHNKKAGAGAVTGAILGGAGGLAHGLIGSMPESHPSLSTTQGSDPMTRHKNWKYTGGPLKTSKPKIRKKPK